LRNLLNEIVSPVKDFRLERNLLTNSCVRWEQSGRSLAPDQVFVNIFHLLVRVIGSVGQADMDFADEGGATKIISK